VPIFRASAHTANGSSGGLGYLAVAVAVAVADIGDRGTPDMVEHPTQKARQLQPSTPIKAVVAAVTVALLTLGVSDPAWAPPPIGAASTMVMAIPSFP
jgi:hypothetical protein